MDESHKGEINQTEMYTRASLMAQTVKNLPTMQEIQVQSLDLEDSLEKEVISHSGFDLYFPDD